MLYVPVMAAIMVFAMWWLFTPGLVNWAGPRRADPFALGYRGDPKTGLGLDFETVAVPTELGTGRGRGWCPAGGGPLWAIYVHGVGGLRENGFRQLSVLHEAGIPTLMIGYRNDPWGPKGEPPFYGFGLDEWRDLEAAVTWARAAGAERIVLVAESMGAGIAGQFLMRSAEAGRVAALVLDSPALDFAPSSSGFARWAAVPDGSSCRSAIGWRGPCCRSTSRQRSSPRWSATFPVRCSSRMEPRDPLVPVTISRDLVRDAAGRDDLRRDERDALRSWQAIASAIAANCWGCSGA